MNSSDFNWIDSFFGKKLYFFLTFIIAIPVFLGIQTFVNTIHVHEDEVVSTIATISFFLGIFIGRYLTPLWFSTIKIITNRLLIGFISLIVLCIAWLFFHADFPWDGREALNILLYWLPFVILSIAIGMVIKLFRTAAKNQLFEAQTSAVNSQSELQLLQSQLSPHFLFNTLNNMYGLSITQHEKIPPLLLKLSDLLRYSVYDAKELFVPLKDELAYIDNYIEFEKIRIGDRLVLKSDIESTSNIAIKIAPMLLIVFIENAFKHSKNSADDQIFIDISIKFWGSTILFSVKNSHTKVKEKHSSLDKHSGFGLANVTKRLELLYPKAHVLEIQNEDEWYTVMLQLKMK